MPVLPTVRMPPIGDGLWGRRLLGLAVAAAAAGAVATPLLRHPRFEFDGLACLVWLAFGARQLVRHWWPRPAGRLVWLARIAGRDAVEPGLAARRSLAGWVDLAADVIWIGGPALAGIAFVPDDQDWGLPVRRVLIVVLAAALGRVCYHEVRFTGRVALTASGVRYGRRLHAWADIDRAVAHRRDGRVDGVRLRPTTWQPLEPAPVIGGRDTAVPEARLVAAIEEYRLRPHVLAGGPVSAPEPTTESTGG
ncbi:hypothetical protein [Micromonospora sp. NPDC092111]|uniref:hypothetical protein n=1 Tax=Micromonospora sp. NPDC092111 TaxID=3364289 RepID=UPI00382F5122